MRGGRWFTDLDEPAPYTLIAEVPGLGADRIETTGDAHSGEKRPNAWCVKGTAAPSSARPSIATRALQPAVAALPRSRAGGLRTIEFVSYRQAEKSIQAPLNFISTHDRRKLVFLYRKTSKCRGRFPRLF